MWLQWTVSTKEVYLASVQEEPLAVMISIDRGDVFGMCSGSTRGCGE